MEKKREEQCQQEDKTCENLMDAIIAETYSRDNNLSEEEYKAKLGFKDSEKSEVELIRQALFNIMMEKTKEIFKMKDSFKRLTLVLKALNEKENKNDEVIDNE